MYWDLIIRCQHPAPQEIETKLIGVKLDRAAVLCWSCAKLKASSPRQDTKDNVVAFVAFYSSQTGPQRRRDPPPERASLCLELLTGRYLRWEEDVCKAIFRKNIRKDRVMGMIAHTISQSPYSHLLRQQGDQG